MRLALPVRTRLPKKVKEGKLVIMFMHFMFSYFCGLVSPDWMFFWIRNWDRLIAVQAFVTYFLSLFDTNRQGQIVDKAFGRNFSFLACNTFQGPEKST